MDNNGVLRFVSNIDEEEYLETANVGSLFSHNPSQISCQLT